MTGTKGREADHRRLTEDDHVTYLSKSGDVVNNCLGVDNRHKSGVICVYSKVGAEDKICILIVKWVERE